MFLKKAGAHVLGVFLLIGWTLSPSPLAAKPAKEKMDKPLTQAELDSSKTWTAYKALHSDLAKVAAAPAPKSTHSLFPPMDKKTETAFNKIESKLEELRGPLIELFRGDTALSYDLESFLEEKIRRTKEMLRPKPGRRPKPPGYDTDMRGSFTSLQRNFRVVAAFRRNQLRDDLIEGIFGFIPRTIASQKQSIISLRENPNQKQMGIQQNGLGYLDAMETELQAMEEKLKVWAAGEPR
jgi:hypothetical protein